MKMKSILITLLAFLAINMAAQKTTTSVEVLYFKAELSCCKARACNALGADVNKVIKNNFTDKKVVFKEVKLADAENAELVKKHNAKSQTLVLIATKKSKETVVDVSEIVTAYARSNNFDDFQTKLKGKINAIL
jgi:hypothetical protein